MKFGTVLLLMHAVHTSQVDITGINRPRLFVELYKKVQSPSSSLQRCLCGNGFSADKAREYVGKYVDELNGVKMSIRVPSESESDLLDAGEYDTVHGVGTAENVVKKIKVRYPKNKFQRRLRCCFGLECDHRGCFRACAGAFAGICIYGAVAAISCAVDAAIDAGAAGAAYRSDLSAAETTHGAVTESVEASFAKSFNVAPNDDHLGPGEKSILGNTNAEHSFLSDKEAADAAQSVLRSIIDAKISALLVKLGADLDDAGANFDKIETSATGHRSYAVLFTSVNSELRYTVKIDIEPVFSTEYATVGSNPVCPKDLEACIVNDKIEENDFYDAVIKGGADRDKVEAARNAFNESNAEAIKYHNKYFRDPGGIYRDIIKNAIFSSSYTTEDSIANAGDASGVAGSNPIMDVFRAEGGKSANIRRGLDDLDAAFKAKHADLENARIKYETAIDSVHRKAVVAAGVGTGAVAGTIGCCAVNVVLSRNSGEETHA